MNAQTERLQFSGAAGAIEALRDSPAPGAAPRGTAVIAHPHPLFGGTMDNKVVQTLARACVACGFTALRFNFRGVGQSAGSFDEGVGETEDALAALDYARKEVGEALPVALAGFSFGSYVQTRVAQRVDSERLVLVGPAVGRFEVQRVPPQTIVIHGEEDEIVPLADVFAELDAEDA